ncbi:MAG: hypothetical protein ABWY26_06780 [Microbacterium sp.]
MATVAASVAVVCAVAMSTSVALADTAGAPAGTRPVVVPSSAASASSTASPSQVAAQPQVSAPAEQPETVPVPEPEDVAHPTSQAPVRNPSVTTEAQLIADVAASGSWDAVYEWARKQGWQPGRIEAWIARIDAKVAELRAGDSAGRSMSPDSGSVNRVDTQLPAQAGDTSGRGQSGSSSGSKREQSRVPPG